MQPNVKVKVFVFLKIDQVKNNLQRIKAHYFTERNIFKDCEAKKQKNPGCS